MKPQNRLFNPNGHRESFLLSAQPVWPVTEVSFAASYLVFVLNMGSPIGIGVV
jgi:hypothetical protein